MSNFPNCPQCNSSYTYQDSNLYICPECAYEWNDEDKKNAEVDADAMVLDANGNVLNDGDDVTLIKDLKVKGTSTTLKVGTKVKNIRIVGGDHNIDCNIKPIGAMKLKSEFVKKSI